MKKRTIAVYLFFCVSIVTLLVLFIRYTNQFKQLLTFNQQMLQTNRVISEVNKIQSMLIAVENIEQGFLLTRRDTAGTLTTLKSKQTEINSFVDTLKVLTSHNRLQQQHIIKIRNDIARRFMVLNESIYEALQTNTNTVDIYEAKEAAIMNDFNKLIVKMEAEELRWLKQLEADKQKTESSAPSYVELMMSCTIVFMAVSFGLMLMETNKRRKYERQLEMKILELRENKNELEQIAFVASHDLKEPLRKIRTFNNRLAVEHAVPNAEPDDDFARIDQFAQRMQELIDDLVSYTLVTQRHEDKTAVDLAEIIATVETKLEKEFTQAEAIVQVVDMPVVKAFAGQVELLFTNLVQNALKYRRQEVQCTITITSQLVYIDDLAHDQTSELFADKYYMVSVSDNGIGFDNGFAERIFGIFQRLHNQRSSFTGKGIGLSICKRIMLNHGGKIEAHGTAGEGATFNLYFPA